MTTEISPHLKPYTYHGLEFTGESYAGKEPGEQWHTTTCPYCDKEDHFHVSDKTGQNSCKVCGETGNLYTFLRHLVEISHTGANQLNSLSLARLIPIHTLQAWGVIESQLTGEYLIPVYNPQGKVGNIYKAYQSNGKWMVLPTPSCQAWPFTPPSTFTNSDANSTSKNHTLTDCHLVCVCEGAWDAMALWTVLLQLTTTPPPATGTLKDRQLQKPNSAITTSLRNRLEASSDSTSKFKLGDIYHNSANRDITKSVLHYVRVIALPGVAQHGRTKQMLPFFQRKNGKPAKTLIMYDNDYEYGFCGQCKDSSGKRLKVVSQ